MTLVNASNITEASALAFRDDSIVVEGKKDGQVVITAQVNPDCEKRGHLACADFMAAMEDRGFHAARESAFASVEQARKEGCPIAIRTPELNA